MIKRPSKAEQHRELERLTAEYLNKGGTITRVEQGETGLVNGAFGKQAFTLSEPKQTRTAVPEVLAAIDARRKAKTSRAQASAQGRRRRPKKQVIYDDFGEPLRVVWIDK
ncbi:hypothetical protein GCM10011348_15690 [Marinobacterium nitratireducens]|uniref:Transcriptional regulator SutA RNAP-binding domain-containing protein n=1 Tax=Marinobacterium nitratireducens TaxID=518897 RepID=A0A917ZBY4_9GAMM|nr:hypothetical protein [Marinobacterium nitratireducens]GGO79996.1 hypothetical protein GCM10011348_15690 [Marinobacterium nitratireducens]